MRTDKHMREREREERECVCACLCKCVARMYVLYSPMWQDKLAEGRASVCDVRY